MNQPVCRYLTVLVAIYTCVLSSAGLALAGVEVDVSNPLVSNGEIELRCTATFSPDQLMYGRTRGFDTLEIDGCEYTTEPGRPMLPAYPMRIALPAGMEVTRVEALGVETSPLPGEYTILPAQPARRTSDTSGVAFVEPDPAAYASVDPYPAGLVEFSHQTDLAGQAIAVLRAYPVVYTSAARQLSLRRSITFVLHGRAGYVCGDFVSATASERARGELEREVRDLVDNPEDVALHAAAGADSPSRSVEPGHYEYVIITRTLSLANFQALADWKTRKGVPAKVVDRAWIYETYPGATNQEKIREFVRDAAASWGVTYFLLGGDVNVIPADLRNINDESVPNDTYYSDYDGDWICEVHVGRAPTRSPDEIAAFIAKVESYEQNPPTSDYARTALMLGFDLSEPGSNEGEGCKESIREHYVPADWTVSHEYDSEPGTHYDDSVAYLNAGPHLVNHIDHCNTSVMGVGSVTTGELLYTGSMSGLTNDQRFSILYTIGCWPCDYPADTCIAEAFVRNPHGGGVGFVGNSRSGWYNPYAYNTLSLRFDQFFFRRFFAFDNYHLGECFSEHKNHAYSTDTLTRYIFTELTLLGDPELPIWTADPRTMSVTHPSRLAPGASLFGVHVTEAGEPLAGATVCLWKGDEFYAIETTDAAGDAQFFPVTTTAGPLLVTVTKRNYVPYLGSADTGFVLNVAVDGGGRVDRLPDRTTYSLGEEVWLLASPDTGWAFNHWSGDAEGATVAVLVAMIDDLDVTAHFGDACPEDLSGDGLIDLVDLARLLGSYGQSGENLSDDIDGNGVVDLADLALLLGAYGEECPTR